MMIQIHFSFYTKNYTLLVETTIESDYVPRIGEMVNMYSSRDLFLFDLDDYDFTIFDVFHKIIDGKLVANAKCHQYCHPDHRKFILQENGWL